MYLQTPPRLGTPGTGRLGLGPLTLPSATRATRGCVAPGGPATDRCLQPGTLTCPAVPNLLCLREVDGAPFEYPTAVRRDPASGLWVVTARQRPRVQRFNPETHTALRGFLVTMRRFGMPAEAILTAGSLYCRCIRGTNRLSNHSFGDAIDVVGVRWPEVGGPASGLRETIVHNWADPGQRILLRRMNACLRLHFSRVIDYHRRDHRDHFHCDMNRGGGRRPREGVNLRFVQEALSAVLGRAVPVTGALDADTTRALAAFAGIQPYALRNDRILNRVLDDLFTRTAAG